MIVLSIDPGLTTGVCALEAYPERDGYRKYQVVLAEQIPWERRIVDLEALFSGAYQDEILPRPDCVVIEAFRLRPGRAMEQVGSEFPSVRMIGIVETLIYMLYPASGCPITYQEPSIISRVQILPEHADLLVGKVHASDAYKHARYYLTMLGEKHGHTDTNTNSNPERGTGTPD